MKKFDYFKGKVCTILTAPVSRMFNEIQHTNVFVGLVEDIDELGIWLLQLNTRKKSYFTAAYLVAIIEEMITPLSPEQSKDLKEKLEEKIPKKDSQFISVDNLNLLKRKANKNETSTP